MFPSILSHRLHAFYTLFQYCFACFSGLIELVYFSSGPFPDSAWNVWFSITRRYLGSVGHIQLHCNTVPWERLFIAECWGAFAVLLDSSCDSHDIVWAPKRDETALVVGHTWSSVCPLHHHHLQLHIGALSMWTTPKRFVYNANEPWSRLQLFRGAPASLLHWRGLVPLSKSICGVLFVDRSGWITKASSSGWHAVRASLLLPDLEISARMREICFGLFAAQYAFCIHSSPPRSCRFNSDDAFPHLFQFWSCSFWQTVAYTSGHFFWPVHSLGFAGDSDSWYFLFGASDCLCNRSKHDPLHSCDIADPFGLDGHRCGEHWKVFLESYLQTLSLFSVHLAKNHQNPINFSYLLNHLSDFIIFVVYHTVSVLPFWIAFI